MPDYSPEAVAAAKEIAKMLWSAPCREVDDDGNIFSWKDESVPEDVYVIAAIIDRRFKELFDIIRLDILPIAMGQSCRYRHHPNASHINDCCEWNEFVEKIQAAFPEEAGPCQS